MSETITTPVHRPPTWFVSARNGHHVQTFGKHSFWQPFGIHHARQIGSPMTACGLTAQGWQMFWEMPFPDDIRDACPGCHSVVVSTTSGQPVTT